MPETHLEIATPVRWSSGHLAAMRKVSDYVIHCVLVSLTARTTLIRLNF